MVKSSYLIAAALPLAHALFIPHGAADSDVGAPELQDAEIPSVPSFPKEHNDKIHRPHHKGGPHKSGGRVKDCDKKAKGVHKSGKKAGKKGVGRHHAKGAKGAKKDGVFDIQPVTDNTAGLAPLVTAQIPGEPHAANFIEDKYIIVFKPKSDPAVIQNHLAMVETAHADHIAALAARGVQHPIMESGSTGIAKAYDLGETFRGYAGTFLPETIEAIRQDPAVEYVERDSIVHAMNAETENGAPWGLARVSHRKALSLGTFNKYLYDDEGGEDVTSYVVDTGIYVDHNDFDGRAKWGKTIPANDEDVDAHGHGSHCAGTIAGTKYGIAKKATVVAVKVLGSDGSGTMSDVIGGVEYVVASHKKDQKDNKKHKGSTANMSLGGGKSPSLDLAVNAAVNNGVHFAVAAGNENQDACNVSPAGATEPVTVGASTLGDDRAYFSNYGKCVDIFAPGVNILSIGTSSPDATQVMSGTSMASPHIAGLLTYFLSLQPSSDSEYATRGAITPRQLKKHLIEFGTPDVLSDLDSASPNVLAYNGAGKSLAALWAGVGGLDGSDEQDEQDEPASDSDSGFPADLEWVEEALRDGFQEVSESFSDLFGEIKVALGKAF